MSLQFHAQVASLQTFSTDSASGVKSKLNSNASLIKSEVQSFVNSIQDALSTLFGEGILTRPTVSYSAASLSITFSTFKVLIGTEIVYGGGSVTALPTQTNATLYLCQDGTWDTSVPTTKSYAVIGTYVSNGSGVTSFTLSSGLLLPYTKTVTGTVSNIIVPESPGYVDGYIDHSASAIFTIPGFITLNTDSDDFSVELLYNGNVKTTSDTANSPPHNCTEKGFWYRCTRKSGYYYSNDSECALTYSRSGIINSTD